MKKSPTDTKVKDYINRSSGQVTANDPENISKPMEEQIRQEAYRKALDGLETIQVEKKDPNSKVDKYMDYVAGQLLILAKLDKRIAKRRGELGIRI